MPHCIENDGTWVKGINGKINDLSYGGLSEMEKYFEERLGVTMFLENRKRELLRFFVEVRNINVHNGAIANEIFSNRVGIVKDFPYRIGDVVRLGFDEVEILSDNAMKVALHIDELVGEKFKLRRKSYRAWTKKR